MIKGGMLLYFPCMRAIEIKILPDGLLLRTLEVARRGILAEYNIMEIIINQSKAF
jgi:hypothetical protein